MVGIRDRILSAEGRKFEPCQFVVRMSAKHERSIRDQVYGISSPSAVPTCTQIGGKQGGDGSVLPIIE